MMKNTIIIGFDPGKVVSYGVITGQGRLLKVSKVSIDDRDFILNINDIIKDFNDVVFIVEDVHVMPIDGKKAAFSFGHSTGRLKGVLDSIIHYSNKNIELIFVSPQKWKKTLDLKTKEDSINYIKNIFSEVNLKPTRLSKKDDHNLAESLCIAYYEYLRRLNNG